MDNKQISNAYAIAKMLGYGSSFENFISEYSQYYNEAYQKLQSELPKNTAKPTANPFKKTHDF